MEEKKNEIILFENQGVKLEVNLKDETVWLNLEIQATAIPLALDDGSRLPKVYILCYTICINIWK